MTALFAPEAMDRHLALISGVNVHGLSFDDAITQTVGGGKKGLWSVRNTFGTLGLAIPQPDEFVVGSGCVILFLNDYGMSLRIDSMDVDGAATPDHPYILRPIWAVEENDLRIEMLPGILPGCSYDTAHRLSILLDQDGIIFSDAKGENIGYLPGDDTRSYPVLLDRGAFKLSFVRKNFFAAAEGVDPQRDYYAPLRDVVKTCLPKTTKGSRRALDWVKPNLRREFWGYCRDEIAKYRKGDKALLVNNWSGSRYHAKPINKGLVGEATGRLYACRTASLHV